MFKKSIVAGLAITALVAGGAALAQNLPTAVTQTSRPQTHSITEIRCAARRT